MAGRNCDEEGYESTMEPRVVEVSERDMTCKSPKEQGKQVYLYQGQGDAEGCSGEGIGKSQARTRWCKGARVPKKGKAQGRAAKRAKTNPNCQARPESPGVAGGENTGDWLLNARLLPLPKLMFFFSLVRSVRLDFANTHNVL